MSKRKVNSCLRCGEQIAKDNESPKYCSDCLEVIDQDRAKEKAKEQKERRKVSRD
jgi:predicted amidophosphoribosyltransferase